jgi:hypothetical protein
VERRLGASVRSRNQPEQRVLVSGVQQALGVADPGGVEYVYVAEDNWQSLYRYQIDNTSVRELVWNNDRVSDLWSVLRDGSVAGMGWGTDRWCGLAGLPGGTPVPYNQDCNSAICPDGSHFMQCEPDHIGVFMFDVNDDAGARNKRWIDMHNAPGMGSGGADMVWYPKWSDFDPRCFTISGSYYLGNNPSTADIYFGRLNSSYTAVETWVRVTDNPICETQARSWIGNIGPTPPVISSSTPAIAYTGGTYTYTISAGGSPAPTITVSGLPSWLSFDGTDTISGTPGGSDTGASPTITVTATNSQGFATQTYSIIVYNLVPPEGSILREYWTGIGGGTAVTDLTSNANHPDNPTGSTNPTSFAGPANFGDSYGQRFRGYVYPPASGNYTFWIASDDASELWLSTDESPAHATKIAYVAL